MSNRTEGQTSFAAELKAAHLAQIEALTVPGLTWEERVERFAEAARFDALSRNAVCEILQKTSPYYSAGYVCWSIAHAPYSLFGNMPGCDCPVIEVRYGASIDGIPGRIPFDWDPCSDDLLPFARIQQERRLG